MKFIDPSCLYTLIELVGEGSFGIVYKALELKSDQLVAIKVITLSDDDAPSTLEGEMESMLSFQSRFVNSLRDCYLYDKEVWMIMEFAAGGSLGGVLTTIDRILSEEETQVVTAFCLLALADIHSKKIIHRDIKPDNILLCDDGCLKVSDFGISAQLSNTFANRKSVIGTPCYMAPEMIQEAAYDYAVDIWALGISIIHMCEGNPPHFKLSPMRAIFVIAEKPAPKLKYPEQYSLSMIDFLECCLQKDPSERLSAVDLMQHPWVSSSINDIVNSSGAHTITQQMYTEKCYLDVKMVTSKKYESKSTAKIAGASGPGARLAHSFNTRSAKLQSREAGINLTRSLLGNQAPVSLAQTIRNLTIADSSHLRTTDSKSEYEEIASRRPTTTLIVDRFAAATKTPDSSLVVADSGDKTSKYDAVSNSTVLGSNASAVDILLSQLESQYQADKVLLDKSYDAKRRSIISMSSSSVAESKADVEVLIPVPRSRSSGHK